MIEKIATLSNKRHFLVCVYISKVLFLAFSLEILPKNKVVYMSASMTFPSIHTSFIFSARFSVINKIYEIQFRELYPLSNSLLYISIRRLKVQLDGYLIKLRSFRPRLSCPSLTALKLDRPNLITISGDFHRGCLLTIELVSSSTTELSARLKAD